MKAFALGLVAGVSAFAIVAGLLWLVLVSVLGLGMVGVVIAVIVGGLSGIKWFTASVSQSVQERQSRELLDAALDKAAQRMDARAEFDAAGPDVPSSKGVLKLLSLPPEVNRTQGQVKLTRSSVLFRTEDDRLLDLPLTRDDDWDVSEDGTVLLRLSSGVEQAASVLGWLPFGMWMLDIRDPDSAKWGHYLTERGVRRRHPSAAE